MTIQNTIYLTYASLKLVEDECLYFKFYDLLDVSEKKRLNQFTDLCQANQYLLGRAMLRTKLSQYIPSVLPREWIFSFDDNGKPHISSPHCHFSWQFNLSHSKGVVVLAMSEVSELGVDVEYSHRPIFNMQMAKHYFSKSEYTLLSSLPTEHRTQHIAQLWTLKESYLKASGLGLRFPMNKLSFSDINSTEMVFDLPFELKNKDIFQGQWITHLYELGCHYALALTYQLHQNTPAIKIEAAQWMAKKNISNLNLKLLKKTTENNICELS